MKSSGNAAYARYWCPLLIRHVHPDLYFPVFSFVLLFQCFIVSGPKSATAGRFGQAADSHNIWPLCGRRPVLSQCPIWEASSITQLLPWIPMVYVYSSLAGVQLHHSWQMKHELKLDWAKLTRFLAYFAAHCRKIFREHQEYFLKQIPS